MEPTEGQELQENAEKASSSAMRPVAFTISVLAVLVAICTVLGHRTHTEAGILQTKAADQWNLYQAKKIRANETQLAADFLNVVTVNNPEAAKKIAKGYADHQEKWADEIKEEQQKALDLEAEVGKSEQHANRFDLGEALLEIALVICSVTLLTRNRMYWFLGMLFGVAGMISAASVLLLK
jgi:predicted HNH restriction endonuclease